MQSGQQIYSNLHSNLPEQISFNPQISIKEITPDSYNSKSPLDGDQHFLDEGDFGKNIEPIQITQNILIQDLNLTRDINIT